MQQCQNKFWDAKSLLIKFIRRAKKELIVIDAYPGVATLDMLAKRGRGVKIELVTHSNGELEETEIIPGLLESIRKATSDRREYGKGKKGTRESGAKAMV